MRVFGSVANGLDHEGSDTNLLVDLPLGTSLLRIVDLQLDIQDTLGVKVDLCTELKIIGEAVKNISKALTSSETGVP